MHRLGSRREADALEPEAAQVASFAAVDHAGIAPWFVYSDDDLIFNNPRQVVSPPHPPHTDPAHLCFRRRQPHISSCSSRPPWPRYPIPLTLGRNTRRLSGP